MKIQNVKGGYDYLPSQQRIRDYINNTLKQTFEEYGYNPIETPILCYYDILSDKYDKNNDILKEIYKLKDQGNRNLGLRYDLTVPFAKFIALNKNQLSMPFKRYEIAKVFRDGPVKIGRDREFIQCDVDVVGLSGQFIEAELMSLFVNAFQKLNIEIVIKYNNRSLMTGLILDCKIPEKLVSAVTTIIDKKDKISQSEMTEYLKNIGLTSNQIQNLTTRFNMNITDLKKAYQNTTNKKIKNGVEDIYNLATFLKEIGIDCFCEFCPSLARGQSYYTGNVFEVYERNGKIKGSIGGGGRYDKIIGDFIKDGHEYPTVGISFGLSSIYELLKDKLTTTVSKTDIFIIPLNTKTESLKLANQLRNLGYKVEIDMANKKIRKSLDFANKEKIPYVIILGENEIQDQKVIIKDMFNNKDFNISLKNIEKITDLI